MLELHDVADAKVVAGDGDPDVVICMDEFGPLGIMPRPGKQWAVGAALHLAGPKRRRRRATYHRTQGVRHPVAPLDLAKKRLYGRVKTRKHRTNFSAVCEYLRTLYPPEVRNGLVLDNYGPHLSTWVSQRVG